MSEESEEETAAGLARAHDRERALIASQANSIDRLLTMVEEMGVQNRSAAKDAVDPVGRTCNEANIGDVTAAGLARATALAQAAMAPTVVAIDDRDHPSVPVADGCMNCGARMIVGGDHDCEEDEEYLIVTNASCPKCGGFLLFYTPKDDPEDDPASSWAIRGGPEDDPKDDPEYRN